jgi:hypothetical protein
MLDSKRSVGTMQTRPFSLRAASWWTGAVVASGLIVTAPSWSGRALAATVVVAPGDADQGSLAPADRMQQKLEAIVRFGAIPRLETQSTTIEEGEVNAYMQQYLREEIPPGITSPTLQILGDNRLSATATLDLDAMNASRPPSEGFDPLRVLRGSLNAKVSGRLVTENGSGRFELESAELGGIPLPRALVSQLVARYDVNIDDPFDLPSSIREIRVEPGQVTVLQ